MKMIHRETNIESRDRLLKYIRQFCEPETCAAMTFDMFIAYTGSIEIAEKTLKELWKEGLLCPSSNEENQDGLYAVEEPTLDKPFNFTTRFLLTDAGFNAVDPLYNSKDTSDESDEFTQKKEIVTISSFINNKILEEINKKPDLMHKITPRQFEEFVAELFLREGYNVELTPQSRDGGRDILAIKSDSLGTQLYLTECKRYKSEKPVGVSYIRSLYGVLEQNKATMGVLATSSYFSKDALKFADDLKWRLTLRNYYDLKAWLEKILLKK